MILLALALFILEAKFPTHGILGVGGVVAMVLGALMLVRSPLTGHGREFGRGAWRDDSVRDHRDSADAAGAALARVEAGHRATRS